MPGANVTPGTGTQQGQSVTGTGTQSVGGANVYLVSAAGGAITMTLPTAGNAKGREIVFKKTDSSANAVTLSPQGGATVDGAASATLTTQYQTRRLYSDGTNWWLL